MVFFSAEAAILAAEKLVDDQFAMHFLYTKVMGVQARHRPPVLLKLAELCESLERFEAEMEYLASSGIIDKYQSEHSAFDELFGNVYHAGGTVKFLDLIERVPVQHSTVAAAIPVLPLLPPEPRRTSSVFVQAISEKTDPDAHVTDLPPEEVVEVEDGDLEEISFVEEVSGGDSRPSFGVGRDPNPDANFTTLQLAVDRVHVRSTSGIMRNPLVDESGGFSDKE